MGNTWYEDGCPFCEAINWIDLGDMQDLSGVDIDGYKCRVCEKIIPFMEEMLEIEEIKLEDIYWELGKENPK